MAGDSKIDEFAIRRAVLDGILPNPSKRSEKVGAFLEQAVRSGAISQWDVICFANEVLTVTAAHSEGLVPYIGPLNQVIYSLHYLYPHQNGITNDEQWGLYQKQLALRGIDPQSFQGTSLFGEASGG